MDAGEIEKCIDNFGTDIYRFCLKLCADKEDAEDLYQQTFLKAYCIRKKALKKIIFRKKCSQKSVRLFRLSRKNSGYRSYYFTFPIVP